MRTLPAFLALLLLTGCHDSRVLRVANPPSGELIVVANRASASLSVFDTGSDLVVETVLLPPGAVAATPGYVAYSPVHGRVYVGDDANRRILVLAAADFSHVADLPMIGDVFHIWLSGDQLWAVDRADFSVAAFDLATNSLLAVAPIPADLRGLGGIPHDIVVDADHAFVTVLDVDSAPDVVVKYSRTTFAEVGRAPVGEDPHVFLDPVSRRLYVACQDTDNVFVLDRDTMAEIAVIPIFGGHGVWVPAHGQTLYVSNFPGHVAGGLPGPGSVGLFAVDLATDSAIGGLPTPVSAPHNITSSRDGRKLYVTHSNGGSAVTVYGLPTPTSVPVLLGQIAVGTNPFGICQFLP